MVAQALISTYVDTSQNMLKLYLNGVQLDPTKTYLEESKLYAMIILTLYL